MSLQQAYERKAKRLTDQLKEQHDQPVALDKSTSNLFRDREAAQRKKLDVRDFTDILAIDKTNQTVEVEGMTTFEKMVEATLKEGYMPAVVPQLKTITIGGAVSGLGIEATSFKYGLVHETVESIEVLTSEGRVLTCTANNEHSDLFYGFPNSYGSLGYVLKLTAKIIPVKKYVHIKHIKHTNKEEYFADIGKWLDQDVDFVDGSIFSSNEMYMTIGTFTDTAPYISDYTYKNIYYRSIQEKEEDYLTTHDFIWRWDTDWFWTSKNLYMENPLIRRLAGPDRLNSRTYTKIMRWNQRHHITDKINKVLGIHAESVIQDVDIPIQNAPAFLEFFQEEIGIKPIWACPIRAFDTEANYTLYPMDTSATYINFGFWDIIKGRKKLPEGYYNKKVEQKVTELGGIKSLYSDSFFDKETFENVYNGAGYNTLKEKYDPQNTFPSLYEKTVLRK